MACKHPAGWLIEKVLVFVNKKNRVAFAHQGSGRQSFKLLARCNMPDCDAVRNVYVKAEVVKLGKIKHGGAG